LTREALERVPTILVGLDPLVPVPPRPEVTQRHLDARDRLARASFENQAGDGDGLPERDVRRSLVSFADGKRGREVGQDGELAGRLQVELEPAEISALIKKNRKGFDGFAKALQGVGLEALRASDTKNAALLLDMGARMDAVCESCHQTFWYPNVLKPQAAGR